MENGMNIERHRKKFSIAEDNKLKKLVDVFGVGNWTKISKMMGHRNARQCRDRYNNYLSPNLNMSPWTFEEEMKLDYLVQMYGRKWSMISKFFYNRTEINLKCHYSMIERRKQKMQNKKNGVSFMQNIEQPNLDIEEVSGDVEEQHDIFKITDNDLDEFFTAFDF